MYVKYSNFRKDGFMNTSIDMKKPKAVMRML